jgi:hypothetical protein
MKMTNHLKSSDDEGTFTLQQFHRDRDADVSRAREQHERWLERAQKEQERQRIEAERVVAQRKEKEALRLARRLRLEKAETNQ